MKEVRDLRYMSSAVAGGGKPRDLSLSLVTCNFPPIHRAGGKRGLGGLWNKVKPKEIIPLDQGGGGDPAADEANLEFWKRCVLSL